MANFIAHPRSAAMLIMLSTILYGTAAGQATREQQPQQAPPVDPFIQCIRDLAAEPQFDQLSHKLVLSAFSTSRDLHDKPYFFSYLLSSLPHRRVPPRPRSLRLSAKVSGARRT
jgi:hypothetical protein